VKLHRIDLDAAIAQRSVDGLAPYQNMKYMYLTHGLMQGDLWPHMVLHVLGHATLEYIRVFERGSDNGSTLDVQVKDDATQKFKRIRIEGARNIDYAFSFVLTRLQGHSMVEDLSLETTPLGALSLPNSLFACLQCSTTRISWLQLAGFRMNKETWITLCQALAPRYGLMLRGCAFDGEATADFVQTIGSTVRCLYLHSSSGRFNDFGQSSLDSIYAALLVAQDTPLQTLQELGLRSEAAGRVIRGLAASHSFDIQVKRLYLDYLSPEEITTLGTLLPNFTKLQSLSVKGNTSGSFSTILAAFRHNGSVWKVTTGGESHSNERRMLDAYGCRDRLGSKTLGNLKNDDSLQFLLPTLLRIAQQAPRMAPTTTVLGLLASGQTIPARKCKSAGSREWRSTPFCLDCWQVGSHTIKRAGVKTLVKGTAKRD
jgi:hypothetical protein